MKSFAPPRWPERSPPRRFGPARHAEGRRDATFTILLVALIGLATLSVAAATSMVVRGASAAPTLTRR